MQEQAELQYDSASEGFPTKKLEMQPAGKPNNSNVVLVLRIHC